MRCSRSSWMTSPTSLELRRAGGAGQAGRPPLPERAVRAASAIASAAIFRAAVVLGGVVALNGALALCGAARAATLEVGPGRPFSRIEDAAAAARPGDVILIHPLADGRPYERTAVNVRQAKLTFRGVPARGQQHAPGDLPVQPRNRRLRRRKPGTLRRSQQQPERRGCAHQPGQQRRRAPLLDSR